MKIGHQAEHKPLLSDLTEGSPASILGPRGLAQEKEKTV